MYIENYGNLLIHRRMLADGVRCNTYQQAISKFVTRGSVVADVGAGTGIMAIFAAQAGATKVYAIEPTRTIEIAKKLAQSNGLSNRIEFIQANMEEVNLPEKVDVIISEWIGSYGDEENLLTGVLTFRDKWLKSGGHLLPERLTTMIALVEDKVTSTNMAFWQSKPYGIDLSLIAQAMGNELFFIDHDILPQNFLASPKSAWTHDAYASTIEEVKGDFSTKLQFTIEKAGMLSCIVAWFDADIGNATYLTNAPGNPKTHWRLAMFPVLPERKVTPGMVVDVEFRSTPGGLGFRHTSCTVSSEEEIWCDHNTNRVQLPDNSAFTFLYPNFS